MKALEFEDSEGQSPSGSRTESGDCTPGHNQIPVALGQGAKAGIDVHFQLRDFPRESERLDELGPVRSEEVPGIPDELLEQAVDFHTYEWSKYTAPADALSRRVQLVVFR